MDIFNKDYTSTDIAKLGIKRERLKEWMARGFIKPRVPAKGPGTKNLFSLSDLYLIKLFEYLVGRGFSRENANVIVEGYLQAVNEIFQKGDRRPTKYIALISATHDEGGSFLTLLDLDYSGDIIKFSSKVKLTSANSETVTTVDMDDAIIINFEKIREQVNSALK
ncbi:MerR family transcriptional regulator [candidate division KSB1 bacterium]|nr:MerR family transcriptional regulator [candidate division KSB1 bacterium]